MVICEDDFQFNNRWLAEEPIEVVDFIEVHLRTQQIFQDIVKDRIAILLTSLKVSRITLRELKLFDVHDVPKLKHLEIELLLADQKSSTLIDTIIIPPLESLVIKKFDDGLPNPVDFDLYNLKTVYLGKKNSR